MRKVTKLKDDRKLKEDDEVLLSRLPAASSYEPSHCSHTLTSWDDRAEIQAAAGLLEAIWRLYETGWTGADAVMLKVRRIRALKETLREFPQHIQDAALFLAQERNCA
jgi:hypothetical protein